VDDTLFIRISNGYEKERERPVDSLENVTEGIVEEVVEDRYRR
jgi:hypothetical protein